MSEANKAVARKFWQAMGCGDVDTIKTLMTEDVAFVFAGTSKLAGSRDFKAILDITAGWPQLTKAGIDIRILTMTAEEDRVACEAEGYAVLNNGKNYNNLYHWLMFFRDGKVRRVNEYCDSKLVDDVVAPYMSGAA